MRAKALLLAFAALCSTSMSAPGVSQAVENDPVAIEERGLALFRAGDPRAAMPLLAEAASAGRIRALYVYGTALFNGDHVERDWPRAWAMMQQAAAGGLEAAEVSLAQMARYIPAKDRIGGVPADVASSATDDEEAVVPAPARRPAVTASAARHEAAPVLQTAGRPAGGWMVQLGAFESEAVAKARWNAIAARHRDLSDLQPAYTQAGPYVRLRVGPVGGRTDANRLCSSLKARGQACFPAAG